MDWYSHWQIKPRTCHESDFLKQVGKTVNGIPISEEQLEAIFKSIKEALSLNLNDSLADLCCGNGLLTKYISGYCKDIIGIDWSIPLVEIARKFHNSKNITYISDSILNIDKYFPEVHQLINKVYMYESLQHFSKSDLSYILSAIRKLATDRPLVFVGSIPDETKKWNFYNTKERRFEYKRRLEKGNEAIGTWWNFGEISRISQDHGFKAEYLNQNPILHTAHYRFDVLLSATE